MKRIRIGKDITFTWEVYTNGQPVPLEGRNLRLELVSPLGNKEVIPFDTNGISMSFIYEGKNQKSTGVYSLVLWENYGESGQTVVDRTSAFELVAHTSQECDKPDNPVPDETYVTRSYFESVVRELTDRISALEAKH